MIAASAVARYKNKAVDPRQAGSELNVRAVLTGHISARNGELNVAAELVNAQTGTRLWGDSYQRRLADTAALQAEIARQVAATLRRSLTGTEQQRLSKQLTADAEVYQLYLKGRYSLEQLSEVGIKRALELFRESVSRDPGFAAGYAGMALTYYELSDVYMSASEAMPKVRAAAEHALTLDETLPEAHTALALFKTYYEWDWAGAERAYRSVLELSPGNAYARQHYGQLLLTQQRPAEALVELKRAQELDPLSASIAVTAVWPYFYAPPAARNYDQAIAETRKIIAVEPNYRGAHLLLGSVYTEKRIQQEALAEFNQVLQVSRNWGVRAFLGYAYAVFGQKNEARKMIGELQKLEKERQVAAMAYAQIYAGLGENDQALEWLQRAYERREETLSKLNTNPAFDSLRSDPRFAALIRRMGLTP